MRDLDLCDKENFTSVTTPSALIKPRTLKGFRDFLPDTMIPREEIMEIARRVYRRYGFSPIDTPTLEYLEILTGKGSEETDRQLYQFEDHGGRQVGMRFDLTVPLARFVAQHINQLGTPFKRYHLAPVWRGENTQAGRYREFMQCDFDTIGTESVVADIETALVIHELLLDIGIENFTIRVNNRQVLNGLLSKYDLSQHSVPVLRALDKLDKIGHAKVAEELQRIEGVSDLQAEEVLRLATVQGKVDEVLSEVAALVAGSELGEAGVERLQQISRAVSEAGVPEARFRLDVSIARGLDYYTGVIFETSLNDLPSIGSICSGGRYDNLAGLYTKQHLPGIGASLGLDRLLAAMESLNLISKISTPAPVLLTFFDKQGLHDYLHIAQLLRSSGIGVEFYPEPKKLGNQLKYADSKGFRIALIAGSQELEAGTCQLKNLQTKESTEVPWRESPQQFIAEVNSILSS